MFIYITFHIQDLTRKEDLTKIKMRGMWVFHEGKKKEYKAKKITPQNPERACSTEDMEVRKHRQ